MSKSLKYEKVAANFFVLICALFVITTLVVGLPGVITGQLVALQPNTTPVTNGSQVLVHVDATNITDLAGVEFNISYNSSILVYDTVIEGTFLSESGTVPTSMPGTINTSTPGEIRGITLVRLNSTGVSGDGRILSIRFNSTGPGTSNITFLDALLSNSSSGQISDTFTNTSIEVTSDTTPICEATGSGTCYYIAVDGNDSNSGNFTHPWSSTDNIIYHGGACLPPNPTALSAGDVVYWRGGNHTTYHRLDQAGCDDGPYTIGRFDNLDATAANPVVFKGYPGEEAIIDLNHTAEGPEFRYSSHIRIEDLRIERANEVGTIIQFSEHFHLDNLTIQYVNGSGAGNMAAVYLNNAEDITVSNSSFFDNFDRLNGGGNHIVSFVGANHTIVNNLFNNSEAPYASFGWRMYCAHWKWGTLESNTFFHIYNNTFINCKGNVADGYGVRTANQNTHISRNVFMHGSGAWVRRNVNNHNYVNITIDYNTYYNATGGVDNGPFNDTYAPTYDVEPDEINFRHNIFYITETYGGEDSALTLMLYGDATDREQLHPALTIENNCYYDTANTLRFYYGAGNNIPPNNGRNSFTQWQSQGLDTNSLNEDPLFTDASAGDFTLLGGSNCTAMGHTGVDTIGPVLYNVTSGSVTSTTGTVNFSTDESANVTLSYGTSLALADGTQADSTRRKDHGILITSLSSSTLYYYNITTCDELGNCREQGPYNFTTASGSDTTPPVISSVSNTTSSNFFTVSWNTNEVANSTVMYGTTSALGEGSNSSASLVTSHMLSITGLLNDTVYYYNISSCDASANCREQGPYSLSTLSPDVIAPSIENVSNTTTTASILVSWDTNESANSSVEYGTTSALGVGSNSSPSLVTSHTVNLSGLSGGTLYYYNITSCDVQGNCNTTGPYNATTDAGDTQAPSITITTPTGLSPISGMVDINATATDNVGVVGVQFRLDGGNLGSEDLTPPYSTTQDSTLVSDGEYNISAVARDAAGNTNETWVIVTVNNTPDTIAPSITSVINTTTNESFTVNWTTNEAANSSVEYGTTMALGTGSNGSASFVTSHSLDLRGLSDNTLFYYNVTSCDASGNCNTSGPYNVTTNVTPDIVAPVISSVSNTSITTSSALINWSTDESANSSVVFGTTLALSDGSNSSVSFVTSHSLHASGLSDDTLYYYNVTSCDSSGNCATSGPYTFTTLDGTAPAIGAVVNMTTNESFTVNWTTNEAANSSINYGTTTALGVGSNGSASLTTSHSLSIGGLSNSTVYYYNVTSCDASGNCNTTGPYTATTLSNSVAPICEATGTGTCYYVDPSGDDNNSGNFTHPWASLNNTVFHYGSCPPLQETDLAAGDVVYFRGGVHQFSHREDNDDGCNNGTARIALITTAPGTQANPITFKSYPGESAVFNQSNASAGFRFENVNWVVIEDITITKTYGVGMVFSDSSDILINNVTIYDTDGPDGSNHAGVYFGGTDRAVVANSSFSDNLIRETMGGNHIVAFRGSNLTVRNNNFTNTLTAGATFYCVHYKHGAENLTDYFRVYNNTFEYCTSYGVRTATQNSDIRHNLFKHGSGAWIRRNTNNINYVNISIEYNTYYNATGGIDNGPFNDTTLPNFPVEPSELNFRHNIFYRTEPYGGEESALNLMLYGDATDRAQLHPALTIENNCYYDEVNTLRWYYGAGNNVPPNNGRNNMAQWQAQGLDTNSIFEDPLFADASAGNFTLLGGSNCTAMGLYGVDDIGPVFYNVTNSTVDDSSALVIFKTDELANRSIAYGTTTALGDGTVTNVSTTKDHNQSLTGLTASTQYFYNVTSCDVLGNCRTEGPYNFTTASATDVTAPSITSVINTTTNESFTVNWTTNEAANSSVEYGTTTALGVGSNGSASLTTSHSLSIGGLSNSTVYYYNVTSCDASGNCNTSGPYNVTTNVTPDIVAPVISSVSNTSITTSSALINWSTDESANSSVVFGTTLALSDGSNSSVSFVTSHSLTLTGLSDDTLYYYNVTSCDSSGNCATSGPYTFTTLDGAAPVISAVVNMTTNESFTVNWTTNEAANSSINYGTTTALGDGSNGSASLTASHSLSIGGLSNSTVYYYNVTSCDASGNCNTTGPYTVTTNATLIDASVNNVVYLTFDNVSGSTVFDNSSFQNNGTLVGDTHINSSLAVRGSSVYLNGGNAMVNLSTSSDYDFANGYAFSAWVYADSYSQFYSSLFSVDGLDLAFRRSSAGGDLIGGNLRMELSHNGTPAYTGWSLPYAQWVHVALSYNGTNASVYINGAEVSTLSPVAPETPNQLLLLGYGGTGASWQGYMDEVRFYDGPINQTLVTNLYNEGLSLDSVPPTAISGNLTLEALGDTRARFTWNQDATDNVEVVGYTVYRNGTPVGNSTDGRWSASGLIPLTTYNYTVRAYDAVGNEGPQSPSLEITTKPDASSIQFTTFIGELPEYINWPLNRTYPGLEYSMRPGVIGGMVPYTFSLEQAPAGMNINSTTGEVTWTPSAGLNGTNHSVRIRVLDNRSGEAYQTYTLYVTTNNFYFVAPSGNDNTGNGNISNPFRTVNHSINVLTSDDIIVFRGGEYSDPVSVSGDRPNKFLAYPGETPIINLSVGGLNWYATDYGLVQGITFIECRNRCFRLSNADYWVFRNNNFSYLYDNTTSENPSFVWFGGGISHENHVFQDNVFHDLFDRGSGINGDSTANYHGAASVMYDVRSVLWEDNLVYNIDGRGIYAKDQDYRVVIRGNTVWNTTYALVGLGNQANSANYEVSGNVLRQNNISSATDSDIALIYGGNSAPATLQNLSVFDNTLLGSAHYFVGAYVGEENSSLFYNNIVDARNFSKNPYHMNYNSSSSAGPNNESLFYRDYNLIITDGTTIAGGWGVTSELANITEWQNDEGMDLNSVFSNPQFVDRDNFDFRLLNTSPACGAGLYGRTIGALECVNYASEPDTTAPEVSAIINATTNETITVTWTTNENANSSLMYGLTPALGGGSVSNSSFVTSHSLTVNSLMDNTTYYYNITSCDASDNCNTTGPFTVTTNTTLDVIAPVISSVTNSTVTSSTAVVVWTTNENANSTLAYGSTLALGDGTVSNASFVTSHSLTITGLSDELTYYYNVTSCDSSGNCDVSGPYNFTTVDATPPVISSGEPSGNLSAGTTSTIMNVTTDENATCRYDASSGVAYGSMSGVFDTTGLLAHSETVSGLVNDTEYTYYVRCQDEAGNNNTVDYVIAWNVSAASADSAPPTVSIITPTNNSDVFGLINVTATATDNVSVVGVQFYINGVAEGPEDTEAPYELLWNSTGFSNLSQVNITATARDAAGNSNSSTAVVFVDSGAPSIVDPRYSPLFIGQGDNVSIIAEITDDVAFTATAQSGGTNYTMAALNSSSHFAFIVFNQPGQQTVDVTVNDSFGNTAQETLSFLVARKSEAPNQTINDSSSYDFQNETNTSITVAVNQSINANITIYSSDSPLNNINSTLGGGRKYIKINLTTNDSDAISWNEIRMYYTDSEISGLNESALTLSFYNETSQNWTNLTAGNPPWVNDAGVNTTENYVWANVSHFSTYGLTGLEPVESTPEEGSESPGGSSGSGGSGGGGGGGGGGFFLPTTQPETTGQEQQQDEQPNTRSIQHSNPDAFIKEIVLEIDSEGDATIITRRSNVSAELAPGEHVLTAYTIEGQGYTAANVISGRVELEIPRTALGGKSASTLRLKQLVNGAWQDVSFTMQEGSASVTLLADSQGEGIYVVTAISEEVPEQQANLELPAAIDPDAGWNWLWWAIAALVVLGGASTTIALALHKKETPKVKPPTMHDEETIPEHLRDAVHFIEEMLSKGFEESHAREKLKSAGWQDEHIEHAMRHAKKTT